MVNKVYVLITSARNEEKYIEKTIQSVISQSIPPKKWIIVSDGSTDRTDEIVNTYAKNYSFIQLLHIERDGKRNFGSMANANNAGYRLIETIKYDFIGNLDSDISFDSDYFERLLGRFQQNIRLGLAGGCIYEEYNGKFKSRTFNSVSSVPHAVQLFRRECYEATGGYFPLKYGGTDWYIEVMARMNGWQVESIPELKVFHHRLTSAGSLRGSFHQGLKDYSVGSHPLFEIFKCIYRIKGKPYLVGALLRIAGFIWLYIKRERRMVPDEFVRYLRREQMRRIQSVFSTNSGSQILEK